MKMIAAWTGIAVLAMIASVGAESGQGGGRMRERMEERREKARQADAGEMGESAASGEVVLPEGAVVRRDVPYGPTGENAAQRMDVYIPRGARGAAVVFMVHGGAWFLGDKAAGNVVKKKAERWVAKGIIFVSVNYRLMPEAGPLAQAEDVAMALGKAQELAESWGGDAGRFVVMGHSAGAHLVALLAAAPEIGKEHGVRPWLGTVVLDSAAMDVEKIMKARHPRFYDRAFGSDEAHWKKASPVQRLAGKTGPVLAVCSTQRKDSCEQARGFVEKVKALGGKASVLPEDLSHKEINRELGAAGAYTESVEEFLRSVGAGL
jgi:arylformamidase